MHKNLHFQQSHGYSLVELMVIIAIISILSVMAIPAYNGYIREGHFVGMRTTMNGMRTSIEDYRLENGNYGSTATLNGIAAITGRFDWTPAGDSAAYTYSVNIVSTNSYDVWGVLNSDNSIWARCDDRYQNCCDAETSGSATVIACP